MEAKESIINRAKGARSDVGTVGLAQRNVLSGGQIEFRNVTARYPGTKLPAIRGVSFQLIPGRSLGIAGRTGSGKTSIVRCLMRMMQVDGGAVLMDGGDVRAMNIPLVRSSVAVVSQEPLMLSGTVRFNLDPGGEASDERLEDALQTVGLASSLQEAAARPIQSVVGSTSSSGRTRSRQVSLDDRVEDGGINWSQGEKQLLALARALVWRERTRVVIVDEGTSSVDE